MLHLQGEHFNRKYLLQINDADCSLITQYFIVDFSLLILLEYNNANWSPDLTVCSEKLPVLGYVPGATWLPRCLRRHWCVQGQERVWTGQHVQRERPPVSPMELSSTGSSLAKAKAGLGAPPLASGQGFGARCAKGCEFLGPSPLLCVQRKDWRLFHLSELNACVITQN